MKIVVTHRFSASGSPTEDWKEMTQTTKIPKKRPVDTDHFWTFAACLKEKGQDLGNIASIVCIWLFHQNWNWPGLSWTAIKSGRQTSNPFHGFVFAFPRGQQSGLATFIPHANPPPKISKWHGRISIYKWMTTPQTRIHNYIADWYDSRTQPYQWIPKENTQIGIQIGYEHLFPQYKT